MRTFLIAYTVGLVASIPALAMFQNVGASPYRDFNALMQNLNTNWGLFGIFLFYALILFVPALGSALGAKFSGRALDLRYIYRRGLLGQFIGSVIFGLLIDFNPSIGQSIAAMTPLIQTFATLVAMQLFCTLGTAWGL